MAENSEEINDESEHEQDGSNCLGYYTRSKRRKLDVDGEEASEACRTSFESRKRKNPIMFVPTEIIQAVFRHISYQELSTFFTISLSVCNIPLKRKILF
nr:unnamed protein product [Callosobruchus analis]